MTCAGILQRMDRTTPISFEQHISGGKETRADDAVSEAYVVCEHSGVIWRKLPTEDLCMFRRVGLRATHRPNQNKVSSADDDPGARKECPCDARG